MCKKVTAHTWAELPDSNVAAVTQILLVCDQCGKMTHSCWTSTAIESAKAVLDAMPAKERKRELVRINQEFERLQVAMQARQVRVLGGKV